MTKIMAQQAKTQIATGLRLGPAAEGVAVRETDGI
jgi:hypothetical protein